MVVATPELFTATTGWMASQGASSSFDAGDQVEAFHKPARASSVALKADAGEEPGARTAGHGALGLPGHFYRYHR